MSSPTSIDLQQLMELQAQVAKLSVQRKHIRSALSGAHLSRLRGRGMEFDEVRVYQAGDEVSSIDWKVTARKGVTHTKIFREERERPVLMCMDYRQSMFFATQGVLKSVQASQAAAMLAWHGIAHGDRLGGLLFSDTEHREIKPARGRKGVLKFLHACVHDEAWKSHTLQAMARLQTNTLARHASLAEITARLRRVSKPGSLIYMLSDFRGLDETSVSNLAQLARHNDVILLVIADVIEKKFNYKGNFPIFDGKMNFTYAAGEKRNTALQLKYAQRQLLLDDLKRKYGVQCVELMTDANVVEAIRDMMVLR